MIVKIKYPRTPHVPWSPGINDDDIASNTSVLQDLIDAYPVVITEKMDGECTTMYNDHIHARSLSSGYHPSRTRVRQLHSRISYLIPDCWRICGENMQAVHSIKYDDLPDWFLAFSIWDEQNRCLDWANSMEWFDLLGVKTVPVLYHGILTIDQLTEFHERLLSQQEGYVIRNADSFDYDDFAKNVFKWVRPNHVRTDQHWMNNVMIENCLGSP